MIGLVYKDLMVMKKTLGIYAFISVIYGYMDISNTRAGMMFAMVLIASTMIPISALAYDERSKWDRIVNTTPLSRREVIIAKYLLAVFLTLISAIVVFVIYLFKPGMPISENIGTVIVMALMSMFYQAVLMPTMIKFGSEKGRIIMLIIMFAPIALIVAVDQLNIIKLSAIVSFLDSNTELLPFITLAAVAAIYILSVITSVKIYSKKDL